MVFFIIPVRRTTVVYSCPRCGRRLFFLSLLPILKHEWRCGDCKKKFKISSACIGRNWGNVFALWSMAPTLFISEALLVGPILVRAFRSRVPIDVVQLLMLMFLAGPGLMLCFALLFRLIGRFAGAIYGRMIGDR